MLLTWCKRLTYLHSNLNCNSSRVLHKLLCLLLLLKKLDRLCFVHALKKWKVESKCLEWYRYQVFTILTGLTAISDPNSNSKTQIQCEPSNCINLQCCIFSLNYEYCQKPTEHHEEYCTAIRVVFSLLLIRVYCSFQQCSIVKELKTPQY